MTRLVKGYCPLGCGQTLFLGEGGYVTCSKLSCPQPDAVSTLLEDRETEHIVNLKTGSFSVLHPLRERLDDALLTCKLDKYVSEMDLPTYTGIFRVVRLSEGAWMFGRTEERSR